MTINDHLAQLAADPDNVDNYLVFGDWLQEQGNPWGTLIALQRQLEQRPGDAALAAAIESLIKKRKWVPPHKPDLMRLSWRWGFIHTVRIFDAYGSNDVSSLVEAVVGSSVGQLVRQCEIFRQEGRDPEDEDEETKLRGLLPHASIDVTTEKALSALTTKKARAEARYLEVAGDDWKHIEDCKQVTWLECNGVGRLSEALAKLPIERIDIDWCGRLSSIPDAVWGIESLGYMSMYDCQTLGLNMGRVNHLVGGFVRANTPRDQRIYEAQLFRGAGRPNRERLLFAIDSNVATVRARAIELLEASIEAPATDIGEGSVVATIGRFNLDRTTLKKRLEDRGATVKTKITAKTTHVLLGEAPKGKQHDIGALPVVLERNLMTRPKASGTGKKPKAAKAAEGAVSGGDLAIGPLSKDLRSGKDARIVSAVLALQQAGAIPRELMAELFCVMQDTRLEKLGKGRKNAKKLFAALGPPPLRKAVATHFKTSVLLAGETKISMRLMALEKAAGKHIDMTALGLLLLEDHQCGLKFFIERGDASQLRSVLEQRISRRRLEISGAELAQLPDLSGFDLLEVDATNNHLGTFPIALAEALPSLRVLKLGANYMRRLPKDLSSFEALKVLDLSCNRFQVFPKGVVTLPVLEELDLSSDTWGETRITKIPKNIAKLETLHTLKVANGHVPVEVPDEMASMKRLKRFEVTWSGGPAPKRLRELLPGCELV